MKPHAAARLGRRVAWMALVALGTAGPLFSQQAQPAAPLTLEQAVEIALRENPARRAVQAGSRAAQAGVREARAGLLPQLGFAEMAMLGDDPVYVFGARLRQQRFGAENFELDSLNSPTPIGDFATRVEGSWTLFDSFATRRQIERAQALETAAEEQLARSDQEIATGVVHAYYAVLLAEKRLEVTQQAVQTAQATGDRSQARVEAGLAVESDLLSARVNLAERQQEQIRARNNLALARSQLAVAMGVAPDQVSDLAEVSPDTDFPLEALAVLEQRALENRPDLRRLRLEHTAQQKSVGAAKSALGPRLNLVAGWEHHRIAFAGSGGHNWTGALELQFDIFQGGAKMARLAREQAMAERISAMEEAARDQVRLEVQAAYFDADTARQQVGVAEAAVAQAEEDLRISQNRYEAGLSTITDLLRVEEGLRRLEASYWEAVYGWKDSLARLELATGTLRSVSAGGQP